MGRKKRSCIYEYYEYDEDAKTSKCLMEGCIGIIKGKHGANLLRHFQHKHKQEYERILECNKENFPSPDPDPLRNTKIVTKYLIDLVTVHGRPFSLLEDEAFQNLIKLIPMVDKNAVTVDRIRELVQEREHKLKQPDGQTEPWANNSSEDTSHSDGDSSDSETAPDYLDRKEKKKRRKERNKCRVCSEFTKDFVDLTDEVRPYLNKNKTTLTLNDLSVELDFRDDSPKTVCRICDSKLQIMFDFIKQLKEKQESRSNVTDDEDENEKEFHNIKVKMECESPKPDNGDDNHSKGDTEDSFINTETDFIKTFKKLKRKPEGSPQMQKRAKVTEEVESENVGVFVVINEVSA